MAVEVKQTEPSGGTDENSDNSPLAPARIIGGAKKPTSPRRKLLKRIGMVGIAVLLLAVIAVVVVGIIKGNDEIDIQIGDVSVTESDVVAYAQLVDGYQKENPLSNFGGEPRDIAIQDLVMNAALKLEASKNNIEVSDQDIRNRLAEYFDNPELELGVVDEMPTGKISRIRAENEVYKEKLRRVVLYDKQLLMANIWYGTLLHMKQDSPEKVAALHQQAADKLNDVFLPAMKAGKSKEEIAKLADNYIVGIEAVSGVDDMDIYSERLVSSLVYKDSYVSGETELNDIDITEDNGAELKNLHATTDKIDELKKPGDVTDVFASKAGSHMIIRLEGVNSGSFNSWDDFYSYYYDTYVAQGFDGFDIGSGLFAAAEKTYDFITTPGLSKASAQAGGCASHNITFHIRSYDQSVFGLQISGTRVRHQRSAHNCGAAFTGTKTVTSPGTINDNCYGPPPSWAILGHPAGYNYQSHSTVISFTESYPGFPRWTSSGAFSINQHKTWYVDFYYLPQARDGATCSIVSAPSSVAPRQTFSVTVSVRNTGTTTWGANSTYRLGSADPRDNSRWGVNRTNMPASVGPGSSRNITVSGLRAPSTTGTYQFARQMVRESVAWFGSSCSRNITVSSSSSPSPTPTPTPPPPPPPPPPPTDRPPSVSVTTDCTARTATIRPTDPDGSPMSVSYRISTYPADSGWKSRSVSGTFTVTMPTDPGFDYDVHTIEVRNYGRVRSGATSAAPHASASATYGRSSSRACIDRSFQITPTGSVRLEPDSETAESANFQSDLSVSITPTSGTPPPNIRDVNVDRNFFICRGATQPTGTDCPGGSTKINLTSPSPGGSDPGNYSVPRTWDDSGNLNPAVQTGDWVCMTVSANPSRGTVDDAGNVVLNQGSATSNIACERAVAKPYFRVYNSDISAGFRACEGWTAGVGSGTIRGYNDGAGKGSGTQLAAYAIDAIDGFSSATGRSSNPRPAKGLTFSNSGGTFGSGFGSGFCVPDYYGQFSGTPLIGPTSMGARTVNSKEVIYVDGNLYITGDIRYADTWGSLDDIPSFTVVVRGNIYIDNDVERLDGFYVAQPSGGGGGYIFTCAIGNGTLPSANGFFDTCNKQLTVNGSFTAKNVRLMRTRGSFKNSSNAESSSSGTIAEKFIFGPEMWLSSGVQSSEHTEPFDSITSVAPIL